MRSVYWKRRNWCAAGILVLYFIVNALAIGFYHFASPIQKGHYQNAVSRTSFGLGIALTVMYFAASWFWAKAKNWPGFVGAFAALLGSIVWFGFVVAAVAPYIGKTVSTDNLAIKVDSWGALLPWVAFTSTAIILKLIPARKPLASALPDAA